jgi:hypothetical protein
MFPVGDGPSDTCEFSATPLARKQVSPLRRIDRDWRRLALAALTCLGLASETHAERAPEDRNTATVIVRGIVESVDEWWTLEFDYYRVWIRVDSVEQGPLISPGDRVAVSCFRWSRHLPLPGESGHLSIPEVGERIRAFARRAGTEYRGNYPDWYDLIATSPHGWLARTWAHRKIRVFVMMAVVGVVLFLIVRLRKRILRRAGFYRPSGHVEP